MPDTKLWGVAMYHGKSIHFSSVCIYMHGLRTYIVYKTPTQQRCLTSGLNWDCVQGIDFFAWKTPAHCLQAAVHDIQETKKAKNKKNNTKNKFWEMVSK